MPPSAAYDISMRKETNKKRYIIAFDFDDTLIYTGVVKEANKKFGYVKYTDKTMRDWKFTKFPEPMRKEIFRLYNSPEFMCGKAKRIDGAKRLLKQLKQDGHILIIITARVDKIRAATKKLVKEIFPEITKVVFVGMNDTKRELMLKHKINFWVDDAPHEIINSMELGIKTFLIQNQYTPYNRHIKKIDGLRIVRSIKHIKPEDFQLN